MIENTFFNLKGKNIYFGIINGEKYITWYS